MKTRTIVLLLIALLMSVGYYKYHQWQQREDIRGALEFGHLATLPNSATNIQVDTKGSLFSRAFWLSFKADKAPIDQ